MPCSECGCNGHNKRTCTRATQIVLPSFFSEWVARGVEEWMDRCTVPFRPSRKTRNRADKIPNTNWVIPNSTLESFERQAKLTLDEDCHGSRARKFLDFLYTDPAYINWARTQETRRLLKRGANAKNWKNTDGSFKCDSLHKADNIYQSLGKALWSRKHSASGRANTWPTVSNPSSIPPVRCTVITKFSGERCKRSSYGADGCRCTQHRLFN